MEAAISTERQAPSVSRTHARTRGWPVGRRIYCAIASGHIRPSYRSDRASVSSPSHPSNRIESGITRRRRGCADRDPPLSRRPRVAVIHRACKQRLSSQRTQPKTGTSRACAACGRHLVRARCPCRKARQRAKWRLRSNFEHKYI